MLEQLGSHFILKRTTSTISRLAVIIDSCEVHTPQVNLDAAMHLFERSRPAVGTGDCQERRAVLVGISYLPRFSQLSHIREQVRTHRLLYIFLSGYFNNGNISRRNPRCRSANQ